MRNQILKSLFRFTTTFLAFAAIFINVSVARTGFGKTKSCEHRYQNQIDLDNFLDGNSSINPLHDKEDMVTTLE